MKEKEKLSQLRPLIVLLIHAIIVGILILLILSLLKTRPLKNDVEEIELEFNQNIHYAYSLNTKININDKGATYFFEISGIKPKNESEISVISFYFRKRLPKNDTIGCLVLYKNGRSRACKYVSKDPINPLNNGSVYSPINIEDYFTKDLNKIILTYSCPKCNGGGLEIQVEGDKKTKISNYFFEMNTFPYLIENVYESNTRSTKTKYGSFQTYLEGPLKFESDKINSIVIRIIGVNVNKEIGYITLLSLLSGIFLYWIHKISDFIFYKRKSNNSKLNDLLERKKKIEGVGDSTLKKLKDYFEK